MDHLFKHLHMPQDLAIEFMATFSRLEYALKAAGYAIGHRNMVEAHWDKFANQIDDQFEQIETEKLIKAKSLLLDRPPRKQVFSQSDLRVMFREQNVDIKQRKTQQLLVFVRTVRNNLFHGGKYLPTGEQENGRNEDLVKASLQVLQACIALDERVRERYEC